jgi:nicotinate-nucleotide adenylyltransferase
VDTVRKEQKIGIFGGTFNPLHNGHLAVARAALKRCRLDRVIFMPAPFPPHKNQPLIDYSHRIAMLEAALGSDQKISISLLEAERQSPSYTVETLHELYKRVGSHKYYLIIGADSFMEIHLWYRYKDIFELTDLIVAARPGVSRSDLAAQVSTLPGHFSYDKKEQQWSREDNFRIYFLEDIHVEISSSDVRNLLRQGKDVKGLLPPQVFDYICKHKLFGVSEC